jgi:RNA polymerase primary sigma factor
MITAEKEVELALLIRKGDQFALDALVNANLRFVVSVAKQYQNQGLKLHDLINEGNIGLIQAAKRFDETRGFKFISYAVWWIRQAIVMALTQQVRIVRLPLNKVADINRINKASPFLEQIHQRPPSTQEIAEELNMNISNVENSMQHSRRHVSMDAPVKEGEALNLYDLIKSRNSPNPDHKQVHESLSTEIERALNTLQPKEKEVICMYYGLGSEKSMNLEEIGDIFGITTERIRQIKENALRRLGQGSRRELLKPYLG